MEVYQAWQMKARVLTDNDEDADRRVDERGDEEDGLIEQEHKGDLLVEVLNAPPLLQHQHLVGQRGRRPAATLLEELIKLQRAVCTVLCCRTVLQPPATLDLGAWATWW